MIVKNVEKKDSKTASFQVEIDSAEFEKAVNAAYLKNKGDIYISGFRKGKAPRAVIEGMYGKDVFYQDAIDALAPQAFGYGYDNCDLKIIGKPAISGVDLNDETVLTYTFEVELYPEVTLGQYKGLSATKMDVEVTDEQVEDEMKMTAKRNARMLAVTDRAAEMGDTANIDFTGYLDGEAFEGGSAEGHRLELGSGSFVPGFEEQVAGMTIGEEKEINITFPENYTEELAGKDVIFKVKLNGITTPEMPEIDDDFIQDISEFNTVEEFRADLKDNMMRNAVEQSENRFRSDVISQACENMTVEIPDTMIDAKQEELLRSYAANFGMDNNEMSIDELKNMMGIDDTAIETTIRPAAEFQVKTDLLIGAVIEAENIEVDEEALNKYLTEAGEAMNAKPEDLMQYFGKAYIENEFKKEKAIELIVSSASVSEIVSSAE